MFSDAIYEICLETGKVGHFCKLPSALGSHVSYLVDDQYLIIYGGTNGLRFFDSILRCDLLTKTWTLMTKQPAELAGSPFFQDGRIASSFAQFANGFGLAFGGCSAETDHSDFMIVPFTHMKDPANFSEITEIM